jgi:hypothetical protein
MVEKYPGQREEREKTKTPLIVDT